VKVGIFDNLFGPPDMKKLAAKKDVKGLLKAMGNEKDLHVRKKSAEVLAEVGDPGAIDPLTKISKNWDEELLGLTQLLSIPSVASIKM
jgi:HEAT repeat protein